MLLYLTYKATAWVCILWIVFTTAANAAPLSTGTEVQLLLAVTINAEEQAETTTFLNNLNGDILVAGEDLLRWHILLPDTIDFIYQAHAYYFLSRLKGLEYSIDNKTMTIQLRVPAELFETHTVSSTNTEFTTPNRPNSGAFLNYDVFVQDDAHSVQSNALFSPGLFTPYGSGASGFIFNQQTDKAQIVRLNTAWHIDYPQQMRSLIIGDSFSTSGQWGRSINFGGIHWGTNFATQPTFITYPLPNTNGQAVVPSIVDLYVNQALVGNQKLSAGPFSIRNIPVVTGNGTINIVTTDLLGRQQITSIPYYASTSLLKPGLQDEDYELGFIRNSFGQQSNDYTKLIAVATKRIGINDMLTGEEHLELAHDQQALGVGGDFLIGNIGVANMSMAASHSKQGHGELAKLGFQRQALKGITYGANAALASEYFTQLGQALNQAPSLIEQIYVGLPLQESTSLGVNLIAQNNRGADNVKLINLSYNRTLCREWNLNISAFTPLNSAKNNGVFLTIAHSLDRNTTANIGLNRESGNSQGTIQLTKSLPAGTGWGYDLEAASGSQNEYQASVSAQNEVGTYTAKAAQQFGERGYQFEASGGAVLTEGSFFLTRTLGDSFGLVQIPGFSNIDVYLNNQIVSQTDKKGNAFIPDLLPYQDNIVRIDANQLPITAQVNHLQVHAVPYLHSAAVMRFPVQQSSSALINLVDEQGNAIPAGATVSNKTQLYPVAEEGEVYLYNLIPGDNLFQAAWDDTLCYFTIAYQQSHEPLPNLGTFTCKGNLNAQED